MGTSDITLTAIWNPVKHSVTYDVDGGSASAPTQIDVQEGQKFAVSAYSGTKDTFSFGGWSDGTTVYQPNDEITMGTSDITLTAVWNPVKHKVTYVLDGGSEAAPIQADVQEGQKFIVATYSGTKIGFTFGGWSDGTSTYQPGNQVTMGTEDITLTAVWDPLYTIIFDANGGSCTVNSMMTDTEGKLPSLPTPRYEDHDFDGWYTAPTGGIQVTGSTVFDRDTTVYAHWTSRSIQSGYTVTFDPEGGSCSVSSIKTGSNGKISSIPTPVFPYRDFAGWYTSASGGDLVTVDTVFDRDTTVHAHWIERKVTYDHGMLVQATGDTDSAKGLDSGMVISEGARYGQLPDTAGYRHTGWEIDGRTVGTTAPIVQETSHTAKSVWTAISPEPGPDDDDPENPDGSDDGEKSSFPLAIIAAGCLIAVLAIIGYMIYSRSND